MQQTTLSVPLQVSPENAAYLSKMIADLRDREDKGLSPDAENFVRIKTDIPSLHFMSMSVFEDAAYDPIFILEANFDGAPGPFWAHFDALFGEDMREMLRCCKRPLDASGALFDAVTAPGSKVSTGAYLERCAVRPSVFHHGNRGLSRDRILREAALFKDIRTELDAPGNQGPEPYRGATPTEFRQLLLAKMENLHPWLKEPPRPRFTLQEKAADFARLMVFLVLVVFLLALPGLLAVLILPREVYYWGILVLFLASVVPAFLWRKPLKDTGVETAFNVWSFIFRNLLLILVLLAVAAVVYVGLGVAVVWLFGLLPWIDLADNRDWVWPVAETLLRALLGIVFVVSGLVLWLRFLERRDSSLDEPPIDEARVQEMMRREDWVAQSHMGSIVHIRPGVLRTIIIRGGHRGLGLILRVATREHGRLGSMRTVHFAHWAFLNNGSRLLFFSNFDRSWGSYLDDFIEKAHVGLTLAWGCGVGFPPTRFLVYDGASHGRRFKAWALNSRSVSRFWYSAYPNLSVDQIERNHEVATGLVDSGMERDDLLAWMKKL